MTTTLAIIGGAVIILGAATKVPLAVCALIRACIPVATAFHDLRRAIFRHDDEAIQDTDK
jgi:hypothetical protein